MAEVLGIGSSKTFRYDGCLPFRGDTGNWVAYVGTGLATTFTVRANDTGDTVDITVDTSTLFNSESSPIAGPGAHLTITALTSNDFYYGSTKGYLYGENGATIKSNTWYNKTFKVTVDKDTSPYDVELILYYQPTYKGYLQSSTSEAAEKEGVNATHFSVNLTIPVKERKLTLIKGTGVKTFECVNTTNSKYNYCSGNTYYYTYGTKASTNAVANTGYLLSNYSGTTKDGSGTSTWTECNGKASHTSSNWWEMYANRTITANAVEKEYSITLLNKGATLTNGGESVVHTVKYTAKYKLPTAEIFDTQYEGYSLIGWKVKQASTSKWLRVHTNGNYGWYTDSEMSNLGSGWTDAVLAPNTLTTYHNELDGGIVLYSMWRAHELTIHYVGSGAETPDGDVSVEQSFSGGDTNCSILSFSETGFEMSGYHLELSGDKVMWRVYDTDCYIEESTTFATVIELADALGVKEGFIEGDTQVDLVLDWYPNELHLVYHSAGGVCNGDEDTMQWENYGIYEEDVVILEEYYNADSNDITLKSHTSNADSNIDISRDGYSKLYSNSWDARQSPKIDWNTESVNKIVDVKSYDDYFTLCEELGVSAEEPETTVHLYIVWSPIIVKIELEDNIDIFYHFLHCKEQDDGRISYYYTDSTLETPIYKLDSLPSAVGREFEGYYIDDIQEEVVDKYGNITNDYVVDNYVEDRVATIKWKYLASMYAKDGDSHKHGIVYVRMTDGTYKMGAGVYVKVDDEWKISVK